MCNVPQYKFSNFHWGSNVVKYKFFYGFPVSRYRLAATCRKRSKFSRKVETRAEADVRS